jgi:hypothetical protein
LNSEKERKPNANVVQISNLLMGQNKVVFLSLENLFNLLKYLWATPRAYLKGQLHFDSPQPFL